MLCDPVTEIFQKKVYTVEKCIRRRGFPMPSIIIVGSGPAGISAALYLSLIHI